MVALRCGWCEVVVFPGLAVTTVSGLGLLLDLVWLFVLGLRVCFLALIWISGLWVWVCGLRCGVLVGFWLGFGWLFSFGVALFAIAVFFGFELLDAIV